MRKETLKKAEFDLFVGDFNTKWSSLEQRLGKLEAKTTPLDKKEERGYIGGSATVIEIDPGKTESLKQEIVEMHKSVKALMVCLALFPVSWCDAEAATSKSLPPLVVEAPSAASSDMWDKYPQFFARFQEVWVNCPARAFEKGEYVGAAKWLNENTAQYKRILETCRKHEAHAQKREWPPSPGTNRSLQDRFFVWDQASRSWVQKQ